MSKKFFIQVYGCQMNYSDAERINFIMSDLGYKRTSIRENADVIILVTCSVRQTAEDRVFGLKREIEKIKKKNSNLKVIITGCMANRELRLIHNEKKRKKKEDFYKKTLTEKLHWVDYIIKIEDINNLYGIFGNKKEEFKHYLSIMPNYDSEFIAYVPISTGCNNFCSYCIVPFTRGKEKSRPFNEVVHEIEELIHNGYKEINLLGQNVNSYGNDLGEENLFPQLLKEIDQIEGDYWIRFVSCHPKDISEKLMNVISKSKHIVHQVHFALQSGSNEILKKMNRPYTKERYLDLVKKFKEKVPNLALTTDVIVGFPGETEEQLIETAEVMEKAEFTMVYINKYSPRKGTLSAKMEDNISWEEKGKRKNILNNILTKTSAKYNKQFLNKEIKILITNKKNNNLLGHNAEGIDVKIKCDPDFFSESHQINNIVGNFAPVKITETGSWGMEGILV